DELFAKRFGVRVDVGPTPISGALDAEIGQTRARPDFSFAGDRESEGVRIVDIATFFVEPFTRELAETRGHHRIARFVSDAVGELGAVCDLLVHGELDTLHFRFSLTREVAEHRIALPNSA